MSNTMYGTIMADPPWPYHSSDLKAAPSHRPNSWNTTGGGVSSVQRYGSMSMAELCGLKVPSASISHLYLWTTNSFIVEAHNLACAWGFEPKTIITWVKVKSDGSASMKMGYYYRGASEHILFAVKGRQRLAGPPRPTAFMLPRLRHSEKPQFFFDLAVEQSPGPYLEMFARKNRPGWDRWGNQVDSSVVISSQ